MVSGRVARPGRRRKVQSAHKNALNGRDSGGCSRKDVSSHCRSKRPRKPRTTPKPTVALYTTAKYHPSESLCIGDAGKWYPLRLLERLESWGEKPISQIPKLTVDDVEHWQVGFFFVLTPFASSLRTFFLCVPLSHSLELPTGHMKPQERLGTDETEFVFGTCTSSISFTNLL